MPFVSYIAIESNLGLTMTTLIAALKDRKSKKLWIDIYEKVTLCKERYRKENFIYIHTTINAIFLITLQKVCVNSFFLGKATHSCGNLEHTKLLQMR